MADSLWWDRRALQTCRKWEGDVKVSVIELIKESCNKQAVLRES